MSLTAVEDGDPSAEQVEQKHKEGRVDIDDIRRISFQQGFVIISRYRYSFSSRWGIFSTR